MQNTSHHTKPTIDQSIDPVKKLKTFSIFSGSVPDFKLKFYSAVQLLEQDLRIVVIGRVRVPTYTNNALPLVALRKSWLSSLRELRQDAEVAVLKELDFLHLTNRPDKRLCFLFAAGALAGAFRFCSGSRALFRGGFLGGFAGGGLSSGGFAGCGSGGAATRLFSACLGIN